MLGFRGLKSAFNDKKPLNPEVTEDNITASSTSKSANQSNMSPPSAQSAVNGGTPALTKNAQSNTPALVVDKASSGAVETRKITTLRDATQRSIALYRTELGSSTDQFLSSCTTVEEFFDYVAGIRLREMPHHGSRWDKVLKWAEFFAAQVYGYSQEVSQFASYSEQAASIIWAACRSLLELGPKYISVLEKAFGVFYSSGLTLGFFLRHHELLHSTQELQLILAACYTDLLKLVTGIHVYYGYKQLSVTFSARGFDELFGRNIEAFFAHGDNFTDTIWATRLESLAKPGDVSVDLVREFLTPHDRVTRLLAVTRNIRRTRADFTCEWFDRHLTDFQRGGKELLFVTGKPLSGKSVLSDWVVERLQATTGRRASEVMTYTIDPDLKTELTTLSVVKGLLLQMLQLNVGDNGLYKSLAAAYQLSIRGAPIPQIETALWSALENGLRSDRNQTIVLDGVDRLKGGETEVLKLLERLQAIASKHGKTKVIVFSRQLSKPVAQTYAQFQIQNQHIRQDLQYFTELLLSSTSSFDVLNQSDRATVTSKLVQTSDGSFEWIEQVFSILKTETTSAAILKRLDTLPKTLREVLDYSISSVDLKQKDTKAILAWLLTSERPLLVSEVRRLIEIDTASVTRAPRATRIEDDIIQSSGPILDIRDGFVRFKNPSIKQILLERASSVTDFKNTGAFPFHIQEAHYDLTVRLLTYVKINLTRPTSPTISPLNDYELDELFDSYELLQYASRYWALHFQASPMHEPTVSHKLTPGFKQVFPSTTLLAVIEGSTYQYQYSLQETINFHLLTLSLRRTILGTASEPVLQTLLNLAILKQVVLQQGEVNEYYYEAWKLAITLKLSSIATTCAHRYIESTSTITIKTKSDIFTRRSELLQYIITIQKETRASNRDILSYVEMLVALYLAIGETEKASHFQREIYDLNVAIHGRYAPQTTRARESLVTTLQKSTKTDEINEITESNYTESLRTLNATDEKRLALTWSMINIYETQKDWNRLEEVIVNLWQSLTRSSTKDTTLQEKKIDVALRYVEFLKQHNRKVEAENILRGVWTDLEHQDTQSDAVVKRTKQVGDQLQILGSLTVARTVFAKLWAYYVKTGKQSSSEATAVSTSLNQATKDVTESDDAHDVTTQREIFDTVIVGATGKTMDTKTVKQALTLVETYYTEQRWSELVKISTLTLSRLWPDFTSKDTNVALPATYSSEVILIINRLALAYLRLRQIVEAELTYRRIFYSVKSSPNSSDELLFSTSKSLIDFYDSNSMLEKLVLVYRDLALEIEKRHGKTNPLTIKTLYTLGDLSTRVNNTNQAEFAYSQIHTNLGSEICHKDAIRAALALTTIYEQQRQFAPAQRVYTSLWQMFIKHGKDYDLKPDFAEDLYQKYVRILKQENKADYATLRQLAVDYRKALVRFYGLSHEATLKATVQLAELNEEKEEHREEAIALYEEADQKSRDLPKGQVSAPTLASIVAARVRLPLLYSTSKLAHSPRAITLYDSEFQNYSSKYGHTHRESLLWLGLIAIAHAKQGNVQSTAKGTSTLETAVVHILKNEKNSQKLVDSSASLANIYVKAGLKTDAERLIRELRSQVIFGTSELSKSLALASNTNLDRRTWVFLVSFETTLKGSRQNYSAIMADLINEVFLYEAYKRVVAQKAPFLTTLGYGSRVLNFMRDIKDEPSHARVDKELIEYVATTLNASKTINPSILRDFFELILVEVYKQDQDLSVLKTGSQSAIAYSDKGKLQETYDLAGLVDRFQQYVGGYNSLEKIDLGTKLSLALAGRGKARSEDQKLRSAMFTLSTTVLKQILVSARSSKILLSDIPINQLNEVAGLLGEQQNLEDLEWILYTLWQARHTQKSWSASVVVTLGRRLVETQFARGNHSEAIHLCEDMCYNLRRVWGPLDTTTLEMHELLSSFYTSVQNYRKAMFVHEDVLRDTVSDKGEEIPQAEACGIALRHLELLKRAYQRLGGWDKDSQVYIDLYQQLAHVFGGEEAWKKGSSQTQSVEKWQPKGADSLGVWTRPESFEFISTANSRKHANYLRKSSGTWSLNGHFHGHRLSRSFSSRSVTTQ